MCGRFSNHHSEAEVVARFGVGAVVFASPPRYNAAPSQMISAIVENGERKLVGLKWGLVPSWAKDPAVGNRMINAKAETLAEKPSFKRVLAERRCLIPADGFYEWKATGEGKQPYHFRRRDGGLFAFAGLWDEWRSPEGETLRTCTIVTVAPNELLAPIHDRMPSILKRKDEAAWLDPKGRDARAALGLLRPYPDDDFECYPVSRGVNSPRGDDPSFIEPFKAAAGDRFHSSG